LRQLNQEQDAAKYGMSPFDPRRAAAMDAGDGAA
jgi:hypothetical protein